MPAGKSTNRKPPKKSPAEAPQADAEQQLDSFLAKYDREGAAFARSALAKMRKLVPGAVEMAYDNHNWLVIGLSPTERPSEAIFSLVLPPGRVTWCFLEGAGLPDPGKRLWAAATWYGTWRAPILVVFCTVLAARCSKSCR